MSRNPEPRLDPRVRQTRDALGDALVQLMHEKPFDAITVQEVLERAGVARSTFYAHFRDKDDLFFSDADEFFERLSMHLSSAGEPSTRVAPVRELFAHVADMRPFHAALVASGKIHDTMALLEGHLARGIERRLSELPGTREADPAWRAIAARCHAGALRSLLTWWVGSRDPVTPEELDEQFHALVWNGTGVPSRAKDDPALLYGP